MPNWCDNQLRVEAKKKEDLEEFTSKVNTEKFLETFIPMPKELEATYEGNVVTKVVECDMIMKTGYKGWYDWRYDNWGIKWDVSEMRQNTSYVPSDKRIWYLFESPWGPPLEGIQKISELFPRLKFTITYLEPMNGVKGKDVYQNGDII